VKRPKFNRHVQNSVKPGHLFNMCSVRIECRMEPIVMVNFRFRILNLSWEFDLREMVFGPKESGFSLCTDDLPAPHLTIFALARDCKSRTAGVVPLRLHHLFHSIVLNVFLTQLC
jgi:hypothetical protein